MSLILNIDTALSTASISLCENGTLLSSRINNNDRDHAAWLHPSIEQVISESGKKMNDLKAVAVSYGPGSYTGLRIGLATAKGLCYALNIPLITLPTLDIMTVNAIEVFPHEYTSQFDWFCPMIDARRMENYMAVYDKNLNIVYSPVAVIINEFDFKEWLRDKKVLFFGNGSKKLENILIHSNAFFTDFEYHGAVYMKKKSLQSYDKKMYADIALSEPLYIKDFHHTKS